MKVFACLPAIVLLFSSCSPLTSGSTSTPIPTRQSLATSTELSEELIGATEQVRAAAVQAADSLTRAAQPTFTPPATLTPTSAHLPTFTPLPNSTPAPKGAYFDVPSDVLGPQYEIQNACYFDTESGWKRYEIYAGAVAGSGDEYSAQGAVIVRVFKIAEEDGKVHVELADTQEYLTLAQEGPLRLPPSNQGDSCHDDWMYLRTPLDFTWALHPSSSEFYRVFYNPPLARLGSGEKMQLARRGSFCWNQGCADGPVISTSATPLIVGSTGIAHLYLPLQEPPDGLSLSAMLLSSPGVLRYDSLHGDSAEWSYEKQGRELLELGALSLKREQDIKLSLEPGYYVLTIFAAWQDHGDVKYGFLIEVRE